ncbi:hypothetical protein B0T10DRAFT_417058, partial [Thelonectria olida]
GGETYYLLFRLCRERRALYYRGSEVEFTHTILCTEEVMWRCRNNEPFIREFRIELQSMDARIDVSIEGSDSKTHNIGRCPYTVRQLIQDQGLDCMFRTRGRASCGVGYRGCPIEESRVKMELDKLLECLV